MESKKTAELESRDQEAYSVGTAREKNKAIQQTHKEKRGSVNAGVRGCPIASGVAENQREQTGEVKE